MPELTYPENNNKPERALAISAVKKGQNREQIHEHIEELEFLAETAGADIIAKIMQELDYINPATVIGKGKIQEIKQIIEEEQISLVIFDNDITPTQARNLEKEFNIKVIDRSGLILDIFAKHARTIEAKTQVELAQLEYLLPRLTRMWTHLSKQYGGIGTKGPGETQIETDRRVIKTKIQRLKSKLIEIDKQKLVQKKGRESLPRFALVGYTNAGKSTLMNLITEADVLVENKLFATLDTTVRTFRLPNGNNALLSDTVGFIRKLPAHLIASFRSTLAEAKDADVLLNVIDISNKSYIEQINTVLETLDALNIKNKPIIYVFNKIDLLTDNFELKNFMKLYPDAVFISAQRGLNISKLLQVMQDKYEEQSKIFKLKIPYSNTHLLNILYSKFDVQFRNDFDDGIYCEVKVINDNFDYFNNVLSKFIIN